MTASEPGTVRKIVVQDACPRCGGAGIIAHFRHIDGGRCFECDGEGVAEVTRYVSESGAVVQPNVSHFPLVRDLPRQCIERCWIFVCSDGVWVFADDVHDSDAWERLGDRDAARQRYRALLAEGWRRDEAQEF